MSPPRDSTLASQQIHKWPTKAQKEAASGIAGQEI